MKELVTCIYLNGKTFSSFPNDGTFEEHYVWNDNINAYIFKSFSDSDIQDKMLKEAKFEDLPFLFDRLMQALL